MNKIALLILVLLFFSSFTFCPKATCPNRQVLFSTPTISVDPAAVDVALGNILTVNVTVAVVSDLAGYEFRFYWLKAKLNGTSVVEGPFLRLAGSTNFNIIDFRDNYNSTHGLAWVSAVLLGPGPGSYGSGSLASISLKAINVGSTDLSLRDTILVDSFVNLIPHLALGGIVHITDHDIAVTDVIPLKHAVGQGYTVGVNVTIENQGGYTESFTLAVYAGSAQVGSQNVTLPSGLSMVVRIVCGTAGLERGNYIMVAVAYTNTSETDVDDNTFIDGIIKVTAPGDVDPVDDYVGIDDIFAIAVHFGQSPTNPSWNSVYDINDDDYVGVDDIFIAASYFGEGENP
jgi:hypothetical protein